MKKILVITGSPRKHGNSDIMADYFIEGAKEAGHEVQRFDAGRKKIGGCKACQTCYSKGVACSYNDDFNELAPMIEQAELIVFASPLYFYSFTAQIKAAIDKMYSLYVGERPLKVAETILLACGETDVEKDFDGMVRSYEIMSEFLKWENKGYILATNVNNKGDINGNPILEQVKAMGKNA